VLCASSSSKYTKDPCASSDIKNNFVLKILGISLNCFPIRICADFIFKHLFMNVEMRIATEVIIMLLLVVLQVLSKLLLELNVIEPCLRISGEALLSRRNVRFYLFRSLVMWLLFALLILSSDRSRSTFLLFLFNLDWLLSSDLSRSDLFNIGVVLHLNVVLMMVLLLLFLVVVPSTSVTAVLKAPSLLLAPLGAICWLGFSS